MIPSTSLRLEHIGNTKKCVMIVMTLRYSASICPIQSMLVITKKMCVTTDEKEI